MELHFQIQASRGSWRGLQGSLALAGLGRGPLGIPAEPLQAAKRETAVSPQIGMANSQSGSDEDNVL